MLTDFPYLKDIPFSSLFDGRLTDCGITEHISEHPRADLRCLTDGHNRIWVRRNLGDRLYSVISPEGSEPLEILNAIRYAFGAQIILPHDFYRIDLEEEIYFSDIEEENHAMEGELLSSDGDLF